MSLDWQAVSCQVGGPLLSQNKFHTLKIHSQTASMFLSGKRITSLKEVVNYSYKKLKSQTRFWDIFFLFGRVNIPGNDLVPSPPDFFHTG